MEPLERLSTSHLPPGVWARDLLAAERLAPTSGELLALGLNDLNSMRGGRCRVRTTP